MRNTLFSRMAVPGLALVTATLLSAGALAAQTGKVTGVVTDSATGQPVEGAQVVLAGTGYGGLTQANGRYFIIAVPPGSYTVTARRIGFQTQQTQTTVSIDVTREINFRLSSSAGQLSTVKIVESRAPLVELQQTGTTQSITSVELEALPVRSVKDALTLQTGFTEVPVVNTDLTSFETSRRNDAPPILIRGGRAGETMTLIDDIPVNNFLFGGTTLDISSKGIEQIQLLKAGLEPRYGNALSGVVNIATREGGSTLAGSLQYETSRVGGTLGGQNDALRGYDFVEGFLSGPVPATNDKLRFVVSGRTQGEAADVLQFDDQVFNPFVRDTVRRTPYAADLISGWRAMGFSSERDLFGKLTYLFTPTAKVSVGLINYNRDYENIPFDWELTGYSHADACIRDYLAQYGNSIDVADVCNTYYDGDRIQSNGRPIGSARYQYVHPADIARRRDLYTLKYEQTVDRLHYKVVGGVLNQRRVTCATFFTGVCIGERIADTNFNGRFVTPGVTTQDITPTEGTDRVAGNDRMKTRLFRADADLQATDHHALAAGIFYQGHDITFREVNDVGLNNIFLQPSDYTASPWDAAAYVQDRVEYDFLTVKLGARFDYGRAGGKFLNNPLDPTNGTTIANVCENPSAFGLPADWATFTDPVKGQQTGLAACSNPLNKSKFDSAVAVAFRDDMGEASVRKAFSPRLGLSFPVTERSNAFFNFGVYYQNPLYNNVYQGTGIGTSAEGTVDGPAFKNGTFVGNPRLRAEQTTSYEMGYVAEFARNFSAQLVAYSKDQSGLTGIRNGGVITANQRVFDPGVTYGTNTPNYTILVNQDYQTVRGFEVEFRRRLANYWSGRISYGYSQATTNAAPPDLEQQQVTDEGDIPARNEIRSDIDQRHSLTGTFLLSVRDQTPKFRYGRWLRNTFISSTMRLNSGFPYTPSLTFSGSSSDRLQRNSGTAPTTFQIDVQGEKDWTMSNLQYGMFLRVVNLLDRKNCVQVFATTGNCDGGASPQARLSAGNFTGESEGSTFFDRPQYLGPRRSMNAGIKVNF